MILLRPRALRTSTLFPYTTLFRSIFRNVLAGILDDLASAASQALSSALFGAPGTTSPGLFGSLFGGLFGAPSRSEEHTSELQSLMRISYAVFCLKKKNTKHITSYTLYTANTLRITYILTPS